MVELIAVTLAVFITNENPGVLVIQSKNVVREVLHVLLVVQFFIEFIDAIAVIVELEMVLHLQTSSLIMLQWLLEIVTTT
jgi:hypothetical protein